MVPRRFSAQDEPELVSLYEAGWTQDRLAEHFGTTPITVRRSLRRAGVQVRGPGGPRKELTEEERKEVLRLFRAGESQEQIRDKLHTSWAKVTAVLREAGLYSGRGAKFGQQHPLWKGGRVMNKAGYVLTKADPDDALAVAMAKGHYVLEHRLIVARSLGRPLASNETVHHINGNKADNRPENLELWRTNHTRGQRLRCMDCGSHNIESV